MSSQQLAVIEASHAPVVAADDPRKRNAILIKMRDPKSKYLRHFGMYPTEFALSTIGICEICFNKYKGDDTASCKVWEVKIGKDHSTSKLAQHLQHRHPEESRTITAEQVSEAQELKRIQAGAASGPMDKYMTSKDTVIKELYVRWAITNYIPFDNSQCPHFQAFCKAMYSHYKPVNSKAVLQEVTKLSLETEGTMKDVLANQ